MEVFKKGALELHGRLSFAPLIAAWQKNAAEGRPGTRKLYQILLERVQSHPELLEPIDDLNLLAEHSEWLDMLMTTLFPISLSDQSDLYAVAIPFSYKVIYSNSLFKRKFLNDQGELNEIHREIAAKHIQDKCSTAYKLILSKFYGQKIQGNVTSVFKYVNPGNGLINYFELDIDPTFIDVTALDELPDFDCNIQCSNVADIPKLDMLQKLIPLDRFRFEGISIVRIKDVTQREAINNIKNILLEQHSFDDTEIFQHGKMKCRHL